MEILKGFLEFLNFQTSQLSNLRTF